MRLIEINKITTINLFLCTQCLNQLPIVSLLVRFSRVSTTKPSLLNNSSRFIMSSLEPGLGG